MERESIYTSTIPLSRRKIVSSRLHLQEILFSLGIFSVPSYFILQLIILKYEDYTFLVPGNSLVRG